MKTTYLNLVVRVEVSYPDEMNEKEANSYAMQELECGFKLGNHTDMKVEDAEKCRLEELVH